MILVNILISSNLSKKYNFIYKFLVKCNKFLIYGILMLSANVFKSIMYNLRFHII
jgi:hypothetical protein